MEKNNIKPQNVYISEEEKTLKWDEIQNSFKSASQNVGTPTIIIAHTIKGKGVSFMESVPSWHGSVKLSDEDCELALKLVGSSPQEIKEYMNV